jgi:hypothetical protein
VSIDRGRGTPSLGCAIPLTLTRGRVPAPVVVSAAPGVADAAWSTYTASASSSSSAYLSSGGAALGVNLQNCIPTGLAVYHGKGGPPPLLGAGGGGSGREPCLVDAIGGAVLVQKLTTWSVCVAWAGVAYMAMPRVRPGVPITLAQLGTPRSIHRAALSRRHLKT